MPLESPGRPAQRWVFDVDGSVIDSLTGSSLRPGTAALITALRAAFVTVVWWSAGGDDYALARAEQHAVDALVDQFAAKEGRDGNGRYLTHHVAGDGDDVVFVDDRPEDLPIGATVIAVSPYLAHNPRDRGLEGAAQFAASRGLL